MDYEELASAASFADLNKFVKQYVIHGFEEYKKVHKEADEEEWDEDTELSCYKSVFIDHVRDILDII
jgi:hypothetical protein